MVSIRVRFRTRDNKGAKPPASARLEGLALVLGLGLGRGLVSIRVRFRTKILKSKLLKRMPGNALNPLATLGNVQIQKK